MHPKIAKLWKELDLPKDDDWYYVMVNPVKVLYSPHFYTVQPMVDWIVENKYFYWEYKMKYQTTFAKWKKDQKIIDLETLYPDRKVCFRFSNPEHAALFKLTWG